MKARNLFIILVCLVCCTEAGFAQSIRNGVESILSHDSTIASDSGLQDLYRLLERVNSHPMVQMEEANVEAARSRISMNSSLMNPMLMAGVLNVPTNSFSFSQDFMTSKMIGVSQKFPFPGKLRAEEQIASEDTVRTTWNLQEQVNTLRCDIKLAYFDLFHLDRAIVTNRSHLSSLDVLIKAAEDQMTTGKGSQQNVLSLELERSDIKNQILQEETSLRMRKADMEAASNTSKNITLPLSLGLPPLSYSLTELDSLAKANRPVLRSIGAEIEQSSLQYHRNDLDKYPDFEVSLQYMQRQALDAPNSMPMKQSDMINATVSFDLPLNNNNKRSDRLAETEAMQRVKQAQLKAEELDIHSQLEMNLAKLDGLRAQYSLLRDEVYPEAAASMETANTNYEFGKADMEQVIRSQLNLLHREHDKYQLEAEYNKTLATIEFLTGTELIAYTSHSNWK